MYEQATNQTSNVGIVELNESEIENVAGGVVLLWIAGATAFVTALNAAEGFGEKIGRGLYYATH